MAWNALLQEVFLCFFDRGLLTGLKSSKGSVCQSGLLRTFKCGVFYKEFQVLSQEQLKCYSLGNRVAVPGFINAISNLCNDADSLNISMGGG